MNRLRKNLFTKKSWGTEIMWSLTDNYIAKTIEIAAGKQTPLMVHEQKEKSIIVISGELLLTYGSCCSEDKALVYKLPEGWSWYIEPGRIYKYATLEKPVRFIEVSSPQLEDGIMIRNENGIESNLVDLKTIKNKVEEADKKEKIIKKRKPRKKKGEENDRA